MARGLEGAGVADVDLCPEARRGGPMEHCCWPWAARPRRRVRPPRPGDRRGIALVEEGGTAIVEMARPAGWAWSPRMSATPRQGLHLRHRRADRGGRRGRGRGRPGQRGWRRDHRRRRGGDRGHRGGRRPARRPADCATCAPPSSGPPRCASGLRRAPSPRRCARLTRRLQALAERLPRDPAAFP